MANKRRCRKNPKGISILVIEDDVITQNVYQIFLSRLGIHFDIASNAEQVIEKYLKPYSLIISDYELGQGMNGLELSQYINQKLCSIPIVIASSHANEEEFIEKCKDFVNSLLMKPVTYETLKKTINEFT
jgi:DNA-binding NtrC family response regulator